MADNIRKVLNIIRLGKKEKVPSLLLALDFEEAFDSVEFNYILRLLSFMKFGTKFITAMGAIYSKLKARIRLNNMNSGRIPINRGTRQGCPLSPLLFALCVEPLANMIRDNIEIRGIKFADREFKLSLFVDDVTLFLSSPVKSLTALNRVLLQFREASGLALNLKSRNYTPSFCPWLSNWL